MREIELVGLYAATLRPCTVCDVSDLGAKLAREQAGEVTAAARADSEIAYQIAEAVFGRYGSGVRIRLTPVDSPRGLWLSLRHRLGSGLQVLVEGHRVSAEPRRVLEAIAAR